MPDRQLNCQNGCPDTGAAVALGLQERAAEAFDEAFSFAMPEPRKRLALSLEER